MVLKNIRHLKSAVRGAGPMVGGVGAVGGFISDVFKPVMDLAPILFVVLLMVSIILYFIFFVKKVKKVGIQEALLTKMGNFVVLSFTSTLVFGVIALLFLFSPPEGYAASQFDFIKHWQNSMLSIERQSEHLNKSSEKVLTQLKDIRSQIQNLSQKGGIISNPKSDADYYHNAQIYLLNGNGGLARTAMEQFINMQPSFVDTHLKYQSMINNTEGKNKTQEIYQALHEKFPKELTVELMWIRSLADPIVKIQKFHELMKQQPDFAPAFVEYVLTMIEPGYGALNKAQTANYAKALFRYFYLFDLGKAQSYYLDLNYLTRQQEKLQEAKIMWSNFGSLQQANTVMDEIQAISKGTIPKFVVPL